jgi:hypothetical protein
VKCSSSPADLRDGDIKERAIYNVLFAAQDPAGRKIRSFTVFEGPRTYTSDDFCWERED